MSPLGSVHTPPSHADLLAWGLSRCPGRIAVHLTDGRPCTYAQLADEISRVCQVYASLGVRRDGGIAILSGNRPELLYVQGANSLFGVPFTPLHPLGSLDDQAYILEDAQIETLVFDPSLFQQRAADLASRVPSLQHLLALGPTDVGRDLLATSQSFQPKRLVPAPRDYGELGALPYTGGTTGKPKGVMVSHHALAYMTMIQMAEWQWPDDTRLLLATPLSHAAGAVLLPAILRGGTLVISSGFDPGRFIKDVERYRITATMLVPTMLYALLDDPAIRSTDLSSLQSVFYGAASTSPTRLTEARERLGPILFQFYGQSEAPMTLSVLRKEEHDLACPERLASCGRAVPWVRLQLQDQHGAEVGPGDPGEICIQGPLVMMGYKGLPDETADAFRGGWLHTGDIARMDDKGYLTIIDRAKDLIITGGFNVFPREVEDVLAAHPAVAHVAVVGVPDERWGEAIKAIVVKRPGAHVSSDELIRLVRERKGPIHTPKSVEFSDSIPLTAVGKPDKKAIRARYRETELRQV